MNEPKWPVAVKREIVVDHAIRAIGLATNGSVSRAVNRVRKSVPIDSKTVVFDSYFGRSASCNPLAIFLEMIERFSNGTFRYVWLRQENGPMPKAVEANPDVIFVERNSLEGALELVRAKYIVYNITLPLNFIPKPEQVLISTWHGIPIKKLGFGNGKQLRRLVNTQRCFNIADINLSTGEYYDATVFESLMTPLNSDTIYHTGFPRNDVLTQSRNDQFAKKKKTILYAPTWRGSIGKVKFEIEEQIGACRFLRARFGLDYSILVKLHHEVMGKIDLEALGIDTVPTDSDINAVLNDVDILVSDYSSIAIDFLLLDRPVVLYAYDLEEYRADQGFSLKFDELPFQIAKNIEELGAAISAQKKPSDFANFSAQSKKYLGNTTDKAAPKVVDLMINYVRETPKKRKKRILIYPGSFKPNGITTSFLNLCDNFDYDEAELFVIAHVDHLDRHADRRYQFDKLNSRVRTLLWQTPKLPRLERHAIRKKHPPRSSMRRRQIFNRIASQYKSINEQMWRDFAFDAAVDFCGYSAYGTMLMQQANAPRKTIFLHNDMAGEIKTRNNLSWVIPESYKRFDCVASVTPSVMSLNMSSFLPDTPTHLHRTCHNTLNRRYENVSSSLSCDWASHMRRVRSLNKDAKLFINIARISPEKNHRRLLDAFKIVRERSSNTFLYILGDGPDFAKIAKYALEIGLKDVVFFTGWVEDPKQAIDESDAFVLSSNYEGQGLVLLEAMARGVPCVASDNDATRYVLADGKGIVTEANPSSLADGMIEIISKNVTPYKLDIDAYNMNSLEEFKAVVLG